MNRAIRAAAAAAFMAAAPAGAPAHDDGSDRYVCHDDAATGRWHCHKEDETDWEGMPGRLAILAAAVAAVWLVTELLADDRASRTRGARPARPRCAAGRLDRPLHARPGIGPSAANSVLTGRRERQGASSPCALRRPTLGAGP